MQELISQVTNNISAYSLESFVIVNKIMQKLKIMSETLPVLWSIGQRDDDVLVDEDEEGQEEAEAHGADHVHG